MKAFGKTDKGLVRSNNQDTFRIDVSGEELGFIVLCDGMGGARAGNIASDLAADKFMEHMKTADSKKTDSDTLSEIVEKAAEIANREVFNLAQSSSEYNGMGTTLVGGICTGSRVILANIGDSRAYLIKGSKAAQMTSDHSLVAEMVRAGRLTPEEAKTYPGRNLITRAVGVDNIAEADIYELTLQEDHTLLLCSDGLSGMLLDEEIAVIVNEAESIEAACDQLIARACEAGGTDNITAVLYTK